MCRLAAYIGKQIRLEEIVAIPEHSLVEQSQNATEAKLTVNGDGFGFAWYDDGSEPGIFRDAAPAWSDSNLPDLCRMLKSGLFLAHVRASTAGEISRANCHPFRWKNWSFMHNGRLGDFLRVRRQLLNALPDWLFENVRGTTDSEVLFACLLMNGLETDVRQACKCTIAQLDELRTDNGEPNRLTCVFSDGQKIHAFRHSCDKKSPTLYFRENEKNSHTIASEPLDGDRGDWKSVDEDTLISFSRSSTVIQSFGE